MKKLLTLFLISGCLISACSKEENIHSESVQENNKIVQSEMPKQTDKPDVEPTAKIPDNEKQTDNYNVSGKIIVIDPGHGIGGNNEKEPVAPGSSTKKAAYVSGASGKNQTEEELNLIVSQKLKTVLEERGAVVYLTREGHEATRSNVERAQFANEMVADICVRIHADGSEISSVKGASVLIPSGEYIKDNDLLQKSKLAGEIVLEEYVKSTGAKNRGISKRGDMTGFNWSEVPVILVELGFMSNSEEDALMETEEYQNKMVSGITTGLERYFSSI